MANSNMSIRIDRIEDTLSDQTAAIARLEATQDSMKDAVIEIKDSISKLNANNGGNSMWQKGLFGMLIVQSLLHGSTPPDLVKDLLGMLKGGN